MSSRPPPEDEQTEFTPPRRKRRPLTLRAKLVISIVGLITAVCVVVGVATEIFLSQYLVDKVDSQLMQVNQVGSNNSAGRRDGDDLGFLLPCAAPSRPAGQYSPYAGLGLDNLTAAIVGDQVVSAGIINPKATGGCSAVPSTAYDALLALPTDGSVHTVSIPGYGDYRAAASNHGSVMVITGMPLAPVRASLVQLGLIMAIVTGLALIAGAVNGASKEELLSAMYTPVSGGYWERRPLVPEISDEAWDALPRSGKAKLPAAPTDQENAGLKAAQEPN